MKYIKLIFILALFLSNTISAQIIEDDDGNRFITLGSTKDEVTEILGTPSSISGKHWYYGNNCITFDTYASDSKVLEYTNAIALKIKLVPKSKSENKRTIFDVLAEEKKESTVNANSYESSYTPSNYTTSVSGYGEISKITGKPRTQYVSGYYKKNGTYVKPYYRSKSK